MDSDDDSQPFSGFDQIGDEEYDSVSEEELDETEETEDDEDCRSVNSSDDPEDTLLPSPSANSLDESDIDDLDDLETTQDIEACSNHSFYSQRTEEASSQASHSPPLSPLHRCINNNEAVEALSPEYGMEEGGSHSHDCMTDVEDEERLIQEISAAEGSSHTQERSCRKRPYNEVNDVRPGQWVAITIMDGLVIPGMFISRVDENCEVAMLEARKSGWDWDKVMLFENKKVSCILETPQVCPQIGSKSRRKRDVMYF